MTSNKININDLYWEKGVKTLLQVDITEDPNNKALKQLRKFSVVHSVRTFLLSTNLDNEWVEPLQTIMEAAKDRNIQYILISYLPFIEAQESIVETNEPLFRNFSVDLIPTGYIMKKGS